MKKINIKIFSLVLAAIFATSTQKSFTQKKVNNRRVVKTGAVKQRSPYQCRCPFLANHKKRTCYGCPCGCFGCKTLDNLKARYWDVHNATDKELVFYTDDGASVTLLPGKTRKIVRRRSFGFAIKSKNLRPLSTGSTTKYFITVFQDGRAAHFTNDRKKWEKWHIKQ